MTNPEITTEQMIKHYEGIRADSDWHPDCPICEAIRAALLERDALKAERNFLAELRSEVLALGGTEYLRSLKAEVERLQDTIRNLNRLNEAMALKWHRLSEHISRLNKAHVKWIRRAKNYKAEVERLNTWHDQLSQSWKDEAVKQEARAEKAEAELERARPLIKAAMEWDGTMLNSPDLQTAALAYRSAK